MRKTAAIAACLATVALLAGCKGSQPDLTIQQFMAQKVDPASKIYFGAVQYVSDETGNHDVMPHTDAEWEKVRKSAADEIKTLDTQAAK